MSGDAGSAPEIVQQYESDLSAWEQTLRELEEEAKGLSIDDSQDLRQLEDTARDILPDIRDAYDQVQQSREYAKTVEGKIEDVLENPEQRYKSIPESLRKQQRMHDRIQELDDTFYLMEERQEYIYYELDNAVDLTRRSQQEEEVYDPFKPANPLDLLDPQSDHVKYGLLIGGGIGAALLGRHIYRQIQEQKEDSE